MRRRIVPVALVLLAVMIDTSVIPALFRNTWTVSLTLVTVLALAVGLGRISGILAGTLGGLLIDILVGYPVGFRMALFVLAAFVAGLIGYLPEKERILAGRRLYARRLVAYLLVLAFLELIVYGYEYFTTALFEWRYLLNALIRAGISTALCMLLGPVWLRWILGKPKKNVVAGNTREVKSF